VKSITTLAIGAFGAIFAAQAQSQEILFDKTVRAGELQCFQDRSDPRKWYYMADKVRLARGDDGRPQFSFLRYVSNAKSKAGDDPNDEAEGGGIVHALIEFQVPQETLQDAVGELRRKVPNAQLVGPIIYKSGKFALISQFKQENGDLATKVLGLGTAPILEGSKAAVSIRLTKLGSKLLWESFKTATPDITFSFEMDISGYRSPYEAKLTANFDQIYSHRNFSAAAAINAGSVIGGFQVRDTFDDLRSSGAIKLETKGADAALDGLISSAYGKICDLMFDRMDGGQFAPSSGNSDNDTSLLERAQTNLDNARREARDQQRDERDQARQDRQSSGSANGAGGGTSTGAAGGTTGGSRTPPTSGDDPSHPGSGTTHDGPPPAGIRPRPGSERPAQLENGSGARQGGAVQPAFSLLATYTMKTVHRSGKFEIDFNKFAQETQTFRFDQNIGNLSGLMNDPSHFKEVNLDDPLFKQRELAVYLDGRNASDFAQYVNFVTVQLRKKHQDGGQTDDVIKIDKSNFNQSGNFFKLLYGYKGDSKRDQWLNYEYRTVWSFFGGKEVDMGWQSSTKPAIPVNAPFNRQTIKVEADPTRLQQSGVRLVTVKLSYTNAAGVVETKQVSMNPTANNLSQAVEFIRASGQLKYKYEITWRLQGGKTVSSGEKETSDDTLFTDEVPAGTK